MQKNKNDIIFVLMTNINDERVYLISSQHFDSCFCFFCDQREFFLWECDLHNQKCVSQQLSSNELLNVCDMAAHNQHYNDANYHTHLFPLQNRIINCFLT